MLIWLSSMGALKVARVQMYLAGTGLITVDGVFRYFLRSQRVLAFGRNLLAYVAHGGHRHDNLSIHIAYSLLLYLYIKD